MVDTVEVRPRTTGGKVDPRGWSDASGTAPAQQLLAEAAAGGPITTPPCTVLGTAPTVLATVVVDPRGKPTTHRFNSNGYLIAQTDALGQTTQFARANGTNLLLTTTDPLGRVTRFTYDANGNVTSITDPAGNVRSFTYEPTFNKLTSITDPLGNVTTFEYDAQGNLVAITDPEQNLRPEAERLKTQITYNGFGQPISTTDPLGNTATFTYDSVGNLAAIADPLSNTTTRVYDVVSRLISQTDPRGKTARFAYDPINRVTQIVDPLNGVTAFSYDGNGNLLTVTDARGNTTTHSYDVMDRLATRTDPLNRSESFGYDLNGSLIQFTDRKGQVSTSTYDPLNQRTRSDFADGTFTEFTLDAAGRLIRASDSGTGTIVEEYDELNRLIRETTPQGTISYAYDAIGRRTTMTVDGQSPVSYTYDAASRLRSIIQAPLNPVTIDYDAIGRRTLLTLPNGISTEYQYDVASRLTNLIYRNAFGVLGDLSYQYDAAGNRIAVGGSFARTLLPDPVASATYDAANQQLTFGNKTMTYDANGNLKTITDPTRTTTFTWDVRNRLSSVSDSMMSASFVYDAFGRRLQRSLNAQVRQYHYDNRDVIREIIGGSQVSYLRTLVIDEALFRGDATLIQDGQASTIAGIDALGSIREEYNYEPFGRSVVSGDPSGNTVQFTGRENDETQLYYYRARYYHPELHRFITEDPIIKSGLVRPTTSNFFRFPGRGNQGLQLNYSIPTHTGPLLRRFITEDPKGLRLFQANLYAYVRNDPINFVDPTGLWAIDINVSGGYWIGGTAGVMITDNGFYPYVGGGAVTPGIGGSIHYSPFDPTPGWNVGVQGQAAVSGQFGYSFNEGGGWFYEGGVGWPPGASLTAFYVFGPFPFPKEPDGELFLNPGVRK